MKIRFIDHPGFHRAAFWMAGTGAMAGLAGHVATLLEPRLGGVGAPLPLAAIAGAALFGAATAETRARPRDIAGVVLGAAIAAAALAAVRRGEMAAAWGAAIFAVVLGGVAARGLGGRRFLVAAASAGAAVLAGRFVLDALAGAAWGPAWAVAAVAGGAFGSVAMLGRLARHIEVDRTAAPASDSAEVLTRARARAGEPRVRELLDQFGALERDAATAPQADLLAARMADLERRAAATSDELARAEYEKAREAVEQQLREVEGIRHGRERVLARLHRTLEELDQQKLAVTSAEADATSQAVIETDA